MIYNILYGLRIFWSTYVTSYIGIATIVIILIMILKVLINQKASALSFKKMLVSFPSEIVVLVMGILFADMINSSKTESNENSHLASIVIALIILVAEYAVEKWLDDKLSGKLKKGIFFIIILMYLISVTFYICIIIGGVYNG